MGGRLSGEEVSSSIPVKFVTNPLQVSTEDELFDLLDANRNQPIKYFVMANTASSKSDPAMEMTLEQKLFRKFFYENSSFIDSECVFVEITDLKVAEQCLGITGENQLIVVQNQNRYS